VWVYVTNTALAVTVDLAPVTREAIESLGQSEVLKELTHPSPQERIVLTTVGYGAYPE
jgi:hypothetical protein